MDDFKFDNKILSENKEFLKEIIFDLEKIIKYIKENMIQKGK